MEVEVDDIVLEETGGGGEGEGIATLTSLLLSLSACTTSEI